MKILFFLILIFSFSLSAQDNGPDILLASNLSKQWSHLFTRQIRQFLKNIHINDPLTTVIEEDIELYRGSVQELSSINNPDSEFINNLTGLDISTANISIIIKKLGFNFLDLKASLHKKNLDGSGNIIWSGDFNGQGFFIQGDSIVVDLKLFNNLDLPAIQIAVIKPRLKILAPEALNFYTDISLINDGKTTRPKFYNANFSRTINWLESSKDQIELEYDDIITSDIKVNFGSKEILLDHEDLRQLVLSRIEQIKSQLIDIAINQLENDMGLTLLKQIEHYYYENNQWVETDSLFFSWNLNQVTSIDSEDGIQFNFNSDFCLPKDFDLISKVCLQEYPSPPIFPYLNNAYQKSKIDISNILKNNQANLVMSFSENYLNKLLSRTIQGGYWKEALDENDLKLGPMGVFSRLNNVSEISIYIDMIYSAKKFIKSVLGTDEIRFPVKVLMDFRIENRGGESVFIIQIKNFDISKESLIQGYKELNLASSLKEQKRLKLITAKKILKKLEPYIGTDVFLLPVPTLNDLNIEKATFESNGQGRINTLLKYD